MGKVLHLGWMILWNEAVENYPVLRVPADLLVFGFYPHLKLYLRSSWSLTVSIDNPTASKFESIVVD